MDELIKQAPYAAALVIVVWAFLQAQAKRDQMFLDSQKSRDVLFLEALKEHRDIIASISNEVKDSSEILVAHNAEMRVTAAAILRGQREKPRATARAKT